MYGRMKFCTLLMMCITPFVAALSPSMIDAPSIVMFCKRKPQWEGESHSAHMGSDMISEFFTFWAAVTFTLLDHDSQ